LVSGFWFLVSDNVMLSLKSASMAMTWQ